MFSVLISRLLGQILILDVSVSLYIRIRVYGIIAYSSNQSVLAFPGNATYANMLANYFYSIKLGNIIIK